MSDSLWPHGLQHTRLPCPPLSPRVCSNSCPLNWWCCLIISFSAVLFSFWCQSFPASGPLPMSWLFTSGGQSIGASASASVLSMNSQDGFPLGWAGLISVLSKGLSRFFSNTTIQKHQSLKLSFLYGSTFTPVHDYWKNHSFDYMDFVSKVMSLLFNTLSLL